MVMLPHMTTCEFLGVFVIPISKPLPLISLLLAPLLVSFWAILRHIKVIAALTSRLNGLLFLVMFVFDELSFPFALNG